MVTSLEIEFHESEIPPRCRKPRMIGHKDTVNVKINEASEADAPAAFIFHSYNKKPLKVLLYKDCLYKEARISFYNGKELEEYSFDDIPWHSVLSKYTPPGEYTTKAEYIAYLKVKSRDYLIVNRTLYVRCYEPYYEITTFGCYGDGTAIFPQFSCKSRKVVYGYSSLDRGTAISDAIKIANGRGDSKCVERIKNLSQGHIEVLLPEVCKRKFKPQI